MPCKVGISKSLCSRTAFTLFFKVIFPYAIELSSSYFSHITVIRDLSKKIEQRACIGKIFARWHLPIAINSLLIFVASSG